MQHQEKKAKQISDNWKSNATTLYPQILELLSNNKDGANINKINPEALNFVNILKQTYPDAQCSLDFLIHLFNLPLQLCYQHNALMKE